jgi:hypothetical protein
MERAEDRPDDIKAQNIGGTQVRVSRWSRPRISRVTLANIAR